MARITKFAVVGASGVGINLAIFAALTSAFHVHYLLAAPAAIEVALCNNYLLNNTWTFADRNSGRPTWSGLARYHVVAVGGTLINMLVLHVLASGAGIAAILANLTGIAIATSWNFVLSLGWTWRRPAAPAVPYTYAEG